MKTKMQTLLDASIGEGHLGRCADAEPVFVLCARDPLARPLVDMWAVLYVGDIRPSKFRYSLSYDMMAWRAIRGLDAHERGSGIALDQNRVVSPFVAEVVAALAREGLGCLGRSAPDEPVFILAASDPLAPVLVQMWAVAAKAYGHSNVAVNDAMTVRDAMNFWRTKHPQARQ